MEIGPLSIAPDETVGLSSVAVHATREEIRPEASDKGFADAHFVQSERQ